VNPSQGAAAAHPADKSASLSLLIARRWPVDVTHYSETGLAMMYHYTN
jgi:hypothetical protein